MVTVRTQEWHNFPLTFLTTAAHIPAQAQRTPFTATTVLSIPANPTPVPPPYGDNP